MAKAAASGRTDLVRQLVKGGANVNADGRNHVRPLFWPFLTRNLEGFRVLLELGADPNLMAESHGERLRRSSIMELAAGSEDPSYLELALKHEGNPNALVNGGDRTIIYEAIMQSRAENVKLLIDAHADLNWRDRSGGTPLVFASSIKNYDFVYQLLEAGADPKVKNNFGYDLYANIYVFGAAGIKKDSNWYHWYLKVLDRLEIDVEEAGTHPHIPQAGPPSRNEGRADRSVLTLE